MAWVKEAFRVIWGVYRWSRDFDKPPYNERADVTVRIPEIIENYGLEAVFAVCDALVQKDIGVHATRYWKSVEIDQSGEIRSMIEQRPNFAQWGKHDRELYRILHESRALPAQSLRREIEEEQNNALARRALMHFVRTIDHYCAYHAGESPVVYFMDLEGIPYKTACQLSSGCDSPIDIPEVQATAPTSRTMYKLHLGNGEDVNRMEVVLNFIEELVKPENNQVRVGFGLETPQVQ